MGGCRQGIRFHRYASWGLTCNTLRKEKVARVDPKFIERLGCGETGFFGDALWLRFQANTSRINVWILKPLRGRL